MMMVRTLTMQFFILCTLTIDMSSSASAYAVCWILSIRSRSFPVNFIDSGVSGNGIICSGTGCRRRAALIGGSVVGGGIGLVLCLFSLWFCYRRCKGRPWKNNRQFIRSRTNPRMVLDQTPFKSGVWSSRHLQDTLWQGPVRYMLSFDHHSFTVTGSGVDYIGSFTVDGLFSPETGRMALTKMYSVQNTRPSTSTKLRTIIQLQWNETAHQFEGKWYTQTKTYRAENRFYLKFNQHQQPSSLYETL